MKLTSSAALAALMLTKAHAFQTRSWSPKQATFLKVSAYEEQLNAYYGRQNEPQAPAHAEPSPPPVDQYTRVNESNDVPYGQVNGNSNPVNGQAMYAPPPPPQPVQIQAPPPAQAQQVVTTSDEQKSSPLIGAGSVAFLGLPLWILLSFNIFFGGNNVAAPPSQMTLPATVMTKSMTNSAAQPAGVVVLSQPITKAEVRDLFNLWNDALHTLDPATVAKRYAKDGVLLPTLSDVPRNDFESIKDYFVGFLSKKPDGKILEGEIFVGNNWAQDAGIYEFTFEDGSKVKARYSFIYAFEDGKWMISHHHSSLMPEEVVRPKAITEGEVRGLFNLWNDALATGDPQQVAARYSEDAVLLPTLSDSARYTNERIADYFVGFLKKKPKGEILEGNVKIGPNWAQDAGIYEFTFEDGSKTRGRYSFVYTYEKGVWKISNHHSSIMPEPAVAAIKKVAEMEKPVV